MRGNEFLDKMGLIDPAYVEAADAKPKKKKGVWVKWGAMAACLCLVVAGVLMAAGLRNASDIPVPNPDEFDIPVPNPDGTIQREDEPDEYLPGVSLDEPRDIETFIFNEATAAMDAARIYIPGYFTEELNGNELAAIEPDRQAPDMEFSGCAGFDGDGTLMDVRLSVNAPFLDNSVAVYFTYDEPLRCYELSGEPVVSAVNHIDFTIYQWNPSGNEYWLEAYTDINGYSVRIAYETTADSLEQAKEDFIVILDCFSCYEDGKPKLSSISADRIPEFVDQQLSVDEAKADEHFGAYMLSDLPGGFAEESIRRYKDQNNDYLSGLWTNGYNEIRWKIYHFDDETQERVTGIADTENYDLSLYPIPRASSVPAELWSIVDNPVFLAEELTLDAVMTRAYKMNDAGDSDDWRMEFSVKYENVVIEVRTKGVEPEWVYQQLLSFCEK